jgi:ADP-ribose pyrophosphatase YjhB (NUDIX family)
MGRVNLVRSGGGIVVKKQDNRWDVLLVRKRGASMWTLPKGHLEEKEGEEEAARREVEEETGCRVVVGPRIGEISFTYERDGRCFEEHVSFYLMEAGEEGPIKTEEEIAETRWFDFPSALGALTYENERNILRQAWECLDAGR